MSRILQISLMVLTAVLCGVCVLQWKRESRRTAQAAEVLNQWMEARATLERQSVQLGTWEQEIARLNQAVSAQSETTRRLPDLEAAAAAARQQLEILQAAAARDQATMATLNSQLKKALEERDALATKLNERTRAFNALAEKYRKAQ